MYLLKVRGIRHIAGCVPILVVTGVTEMEDFTMNNKPSIKIGIVAEQGLFPREPVSEQKKSFS